MKKNTKTPLDTDITGILGYNNSEEGEGVADMDDPKYQSVSSVDDLENRQEPEENPEDKKVEEKDEHEDNTPIPEDVLNNTKPTPEPKQADSLEEPEEVNEEDNQVSAAEAEQVGAFFDAFAEANGWTVDEGERPTSIEGIVDYIKDVVEQNSVPQYADDRIAQLDKYVKDGGRFEDFYASQQRAMNYETLDMEDETNQKAVVREYLKLQNYSDEQINRKIERYEDADMLEDEANDNLDRLKAIKAQQLQQAQAQQEQIRLENEQRVNQFVTDLTTSIQNLDNIRGIKVPKEDRKALFDYITRVDADGYTQYQKDFGKNQVANLIESAYFTMKGDALLGEARRDGQTSAANKLRNMLKHQTRNHSSYNSDDERNPQAWEIASKFLR